MFLSQGKVSVMVGACTECIVVCGVAAVAIDGLVQKKTGASVDSCYSGLFGVRWLGAMLGNGTDEVIGGRCGVCGDSLGDFVDCS